MTLIVMLAWDRTAHGTVPAAGSGPQVSPASADSMPAIPDRDRIRLAEAYRLAGAVQDLVWPHWSTAPFAVLLVTPEAEYLVHHPSPSPDFTPGPYDSLLDSRVYWRHRIFPTTIQATFPAVGGISTVVIGQAENADPPQNSTRWVLTVMHEHFHQWQESRPGYQAAVDSLKLARGDSTGMWMLNYPFPYADSTIAARFDTLCKLSARAIRLRGLPSFAPAYDSVLRARHEFWDRVSGDDARYLRFQMWKEGVARYTEYDVARVAAARYILSPRYLGLADYTPFLTESRNLLREILDQLSSLSLASSKRLAVYPAGAAEALLLDAVRPSWRAMYTTARFSLDRLFQQIGPPLWRRPPPGNGTSPEPWPGGPDGQQPPNLEN